MAGYYARKVFDLIASTPGGLTLDQLVLLTEWPRGAVRRTLKTLRTLDLLRAIAIKRAHVYRYVAKPGAVCPGDQRRGTRRLRWYSAARAPSVQP
jgi:hypothetical protein